MKRPEAEYVLPVDKPVGPTSHDVVQAARKALAQRRIGHTGTLDPFASGLMLLCVGRATRLAEYLTGLDKRYVAGARLGETTTTDDLEGEVLERSERWRGLERGAVASALGSLRGPLDQVPPQYSAKKVAGEAMYRRARRGERVELPAVRVEVYDIRLGEAVLPDIEFEVHCSSGTYVRALARDLGAELGVGAHLTALRRTKVGRFDVARAIPLERLTNAGALAAVRLTPLAALAHLPRVQVDADGARRLAHGQRVPFDGAPSKGPLAVTHDGDLLAIAGVEGGALRPSKVFA